jgi:predicted DNA binding CopG/RHH family protein
MALDLPRIRSPLTPDEWQRLPDNLKAKRGSDQSNVEHRAYVEVHVRVTPAEAARLDKAAERAGMPRATYLRRIIGNLRVRP